MKNNILQVYSCCDLDCKILTFPTKKDTAKDPENTRAITSNIYIFLKSVLNG